MKIQTWEVLPAARRAKLYRMLWRYRGILGVTRHDDQSRRTTCGTRMPIGHQWTCDNGTRIGGRSGAVGVQGVIEVV
nr:hypothetical protein [Streptococcus dysgalactiae]